MAASPARPAPDAAQARPAGRAWGFGRTDLAVPWYVPYAFIGPQVALATVFILKPGVETFWLSLQRWILSLGQPPSFVGATNYIGLVADPLFHQALRNTVAYVLATVPATLLLALGLALAVNQRLGPLNGLFRSAFFVPVVVPTVVVALVWRYMLDPRAGVVNAGLRAAGLPAPSWLTDPAVALLSVSVAGIWQHLGYVMVIFLAGLQAIPATVYDAAAVDGAGPWQRFRHVTVPLLAPTTLFALIISVIGGFKVFDQVYVMTGGGPANATLTLVQYLYLQAFDFFDVGRGSAAAVVLLLILAACTYLLTRFYTREVEY